MARRGQELLRGWSNDTSEEIGDRGAGRGRDSRRHDRCHHRTRRSPGGDWNWHRRWCARLLLRVRLLPAGTLLRVQLLLQWLLRLADLHRRRVHWRSMGLWPALLPLVGWTPVVLESRP